MSAWSARRRVNVTVTFIVIAVFICSGVLFLLLHSPETCDDGIQNDGEFGVDCGGSCPDACPVPPKKLLDVWTRAFKVADGVYSAVAYIENQNENLYVPAVQFEIQLRDGNNDIITRASQKSVISENGVTPIFVPHIITKARVPARAEFRFTEEPVFRVRDSAYMFDVTDVTVSAREGVSPTVSAIATNVGPEAVREVDFVVIVYDDDDNAIAASRTFERYIAPGGRRELRYSWVHPFDLRRGSCPGGLCVKDVKRVEIIPVVLD